MESERQFLHLGSPTRVGVPGHFKLTVPAGMAARVRLLDEIAEQRPLHARGTVDEIVEAIVRKVEGR
jgi:hypothetical protein